MKIEIKKGEFKEGYAWRIESPYGEIEQDDACKHCTETEDGLFQVRAAVIALNEGGFNCTSVCLDCILENAVKL